MSCRIIPSRHPRMISKRIRTIANEMKTACQTEDPAISDCGFWIAEGKRCKGEVSGLRGVLTLRNPVFQIRNRLLPQGVIAQDESGHRFDDRHGAGQDAGVMAA